MRSGQSPNGLESLASASSAIPALPVGKASPLDLGKLLPHEDPGA